MVQNIQDKVTSLTNRKLWLAPLAGYTNQPFRRICKECGADVLVSEMVSADGVVHAGTKTLELAKFIEEERPFGIQLFGTKPDIMCHATEIILKLEPDFIDINMGCPVKKVVSVGAGSALMKSPDIAIEIVRELKNITSSAGIPLSAKIRSGWDANSLNYLPFAEDLVKAGIDFLIFHPRSRSQMFTGKSTWSQIAELKKVLSVPLVGNGDILDAHDALRMFEETGCDSVMIGRGALGKPWVFNEIQATLQNTAFNHISPSRMESLIKMHFELVIENSHISRRQAILEMRSHFCYYTKGIPGGAKVRDIINHTEDEQVIMQAIDHLYFQVEQRDEH